MCIFKKVSDCEKDATQASPKFKQDSVEVLESHHHPSHVEAGKVLLWCMLL